MENASKALIIAGAILISILLIGLGVYIYNQSQSTVSQANLDSEAAQAQNSKFEAYLGTNVSAAQVKTLLSLINTNNITAAGKDEAKTIGVYHGTKPDDDTSEYSTDMTTLSAQIKAGQSYTVKIPNSKLFDDTKNAASAAIDGFSGEMGDAARAAKPSSGAYYKNAYYRLIAIIPNQS